MREYISRLFKAELPWIPSPINLDFTGLIFIIDRREIKKWLKQLNMKAGYKHFF